MNSKGKREPILDDPETLKMVKELFKKEYPNTSKILDQKDHPNYPSVWSLWHSFRAGFEAGYWADEIPLN